MPVVSILDLLNVPAILALGIITSIEDIRHNRIRNKYVAAAIIYSLVSLCAGLIYLALRHEAINWMYVAIFFANIFSSLVIGILLWLGGLWSAGDAKLFSAYASLIPLSTYIWGNVHFPSFVVLANVFIPAFIVFLFKLILKLKIKDVASEAKKIFTLKQASFLLFFVFGFSWAISAMFAFFSLKDTFFLNFSIMLVLFVASRAILRKYFIHVCILFSVLRLAFDFDPAGFLVPIRQLIFLFLFQFLLAIAYYPLSKPVYIEDLQPGMAPAEDIRLLEGKYLKTKKAPIFQYGPANASKFGEMVLDGNARLSQQDVSLLKSLHSSGKIKDHQLFIKEEIPFAVYLFIGVILTLAFRGNFIVMLLSLINK